MSHAWNAWKRKPRECNSKVALPRKHETVLLLEGKAHAIRGPLSSSEYAGAKLLRSKPASLEMFPEIPQLLALLGGPSCLDYSRAGRQRFKNRDVVYSFEVASYCIH